MVGVFFDGDGQECFKGYDLVVREEEAARFALHKLLVEMLRPG